MDNKKALDYKNIYNIVSSFDIPVDFSKSMKFELLNQGYMNTVVKVIIDSSVYVLSFFNPNRYSNKYSKDLLEEIHCAIGFLKNNGLPVRDACFLPNGDTVLMLERDNFSQIKNDWKGKEKIRLVTLYNYCGGVTIPWEAYTRRHIKSLGMSMLRMHEIWARYRACNKIYDWSTYFEVDSRRMLAYFTRNSSYIQKKLSICIDVREINQIIKNIRLMNKNSLLNSSWQFIHCDFVRGNLLFSTEKEKDIYPITGILDFEKMLFGPVEVDVARTLAFLYVDCKYKKKDEVENYFSQGYVKKIDKVYLELLIKYFLWRDLWKLLACNPYESLLDNEHYLRTVANLRTNE